VHKLRQRVQRFVDRYFDDGNPNSAEKMAFEEMLPIRSSEKAISS
jgi:hypothetical protein